MAPFFVVGDQVGGCMVCACVRVYDFNTFPPCRPGPKLLPFIYCLTILGVFYAATLGF